MSRLHAFAFRFAAVPCLQKAPSSESPLWSGPRPDRIESHDKEHLASGKGRFFRKPSCERKKHWWMRLVEAASDLDQSIFGLSANEIEAL